MADIKDFLGKDTAGLPNWAWIVVVVAGIGAAYIVPKLFGTSGSSSQTSDTSGTTDTSGLGLAIDPTTGLPYAVEGLVPSGGTVGGTTGGSTSTGGTATPPIIQSSPPPPTNPAPPPNPPPTNPAPPTNPTGSCHRWVVLAKWPAPQSDLDQIASKYGVSLTRIEQLNPWIKDPNRVPAGARVCIA